MEHRMKIEQWMLEELKKYDPCSTRYKVGQDISVIKFLDAVWVEDHCSELR